jgi:hypothetical protein
VQNTLTYAYCNVFLIVLSAGESFELVLVVESTSVSGRPEYAIGRVLEFLFYSLTGMNYAVNMCKTFSSTSH